MSFPDISAEIVALAPELRGRLAANEPLAPLTWFRVGGPAQLLFSPADEADLAYFLARLPREIPVTVIGLGSNLIVRDGGVPGVVVRLTAKGFGAIAVEEGERIRVGAAVPDVKLARAAADAGIDGLAFYRGIPGGVGGALRMNAGAHGGETKDALIEARGVDRAGNLRIYTNADLGFSYRHSDAPDDMIFTQALYQGRKGDPAAILAEMERITQAREASQPIREKTGGSTFANPPGHKAWQLIDEAGCRGLVIGDAQVSEMHCNFLVNRGQATAADVEALGEEVRRRVQEKSGVLLRWEIKRIGLALA
ncbi:UDP-N-acetylenolpyruvoylglucosamine reductase [Methylosinus sp. R-45379]|uniref:UDP-N-acetylmuramate dehydrogenase n=1 Tax=Methylosinus sp. R-45379 TaxID=980563 RepID=UPI0007C98F55|nr:UDP-N-acetylmuramate dehydrogenase [Methylosinus sp. R-45379]OAI27594.1 UDP-N-acetylenolpyruvoylglucosamine reductase [Methylosinus sp. R-45379]